MTTKEPSSAVSERVEEGEHLKSLIDQYWSLAYREGAEGRTRDTDSGAAQATQHQINLSIAALTLPQEVAAEMTDGNLRHTADNLNLLRKLTDQEAVAFGRAVLAASRSPAPAGVAGGVDASRGLSTLQEPKYTVNGSAIVNRASGEAIPDDEPVFIFRARDKHACSMLGEYAQFCSDPAHREAVNQRFIQFGEFAEAHPERMREPDTAATQAQPSPNPAVGGSGANVEAAAKVLAECMDYPWAAMPEQGRANMRKHASAVIKAALDMSANPATEQGRAGDVGAGK